MSGIWKVLGAAALIVVAALLHSFYVSYELNGNAYIFKWKATAAQHEAYVEAVARRLERGPSQRLVRTPQADYERQLSAFLKDPANRCRFTGNDPSQPDWVIALREAGGHFHTCNKPIPKRGAKMVPDPGVTFEQALAQARSQTPFSTYGLAPTQNAAGDKPRRTAITRSLWLGVVLPLVFFFSALGLLATLLASRKRPIPEVDAAHIDGRSASRTEREPPKPPSLPLVDLLRQRFGVDLGIVRGSATRADPLVISEPVDYVSLEYAIAEFLMSGEEYKKEKQVLQNLGGQMVDELTYATKTPGAQQWERTRRFYFDITTGYRRLGK